MQFEQLLDVLLKDLLVREMWVYILAMLAEVVSKVEITI